MEPHAAERVGHDERQTASEHIFSGQRTDRASGELRRSFEIPRGIIAHISYPDTSALGNDIP